MQKLFNFLYRYRAFLFFILLEILCFSLIVRNNSYQNAAFFTSSNYYVGEVMLIEHNVSKYFSLTEVNKELAEENAALYVKISVLENKKNASHARDTIDYFRTHQYGFVSAKVINNSTNRSSNYLTLDKGQADSIHTGMGVVGPRGIVGRVKSCSKHFSTVISLLHEKMKISAKIKRGDIDGFVVWTGGDAQTAELSFVDRHHKLRVNDTIVTSGYNSLFPAGIMIGTIKSFSDQGGSFYKIDVALSTDFSTLSYVYVIENNLKLEKDSLESTTVGVIGQ